MGLFYVFMQCWLACIFSSLFFPHLCLVFFSPVFALAFLRKSRLFCLWLALGIGLGLDLICCETAFGYTALNYLATTALLRGKRIRPYDEHPISFLLLSIGFSWLSLLFSQIYLSLPPLLSFFPLITSLHIIYVLVWILLPRSLLLRLIPNKKNKMV